jgi:hypothetical protein
MSIEKERWGDCPIAEYGLRNSESEIIEKIRRKNTEQSNTCDSSIPLVQYSTLLI